jgi:hypothetical protein
MQHRRSLRAQLVQWESQSTGSTEISQHQIGEEMWENLAGSLTTTTSSLTRGMRKK